MFQKQVSTNSDDEPPLLRRLVKKIIIANIMIGFFWPQLAHEAAQYSFEYHPWDFGTIKAPIIVQTERRKEEPLPAVKPVKTYGNGTCVPYARARTGINLFGWAGSFLDQAEEAGYTVTEVPMEGCMVVTSESGGHVAVVEKVVDEGIIVSEQNFKGLYVVSERMIPFEENIILGYIR